MVQTDSAGVPYGVGMKLPENTADQFRVYLRIMEKMFKKELTRDRVKDIISKIDEKVKAGLSQGGITINNVVTFVIEVWTGEVTSILQERR